MPLTRLGKSLAYGVPRSLHSRVQVGSLVRIPLQKRTGLGIVVQLGSKTQLAKPQLRFLSHLLYDFPVLTPDLLKLAEWVQAYYGVATETVFETMIPSPLRSGTKAQQRRLLQCGKPAPAEVLSALRRRAPKQAALYDFLRTQSAPIPHALVQKRLGVSAASCNALIKKGWIIERLQRHERLAYNDELAAGETVPPAGEVSLTAEQTSAIRDLEQSLAAGSFKPHLLHGVTGSGKTEVYIHIALKVLEQGNGLIFLVPEIALTPQTVGRLGSRLQAALGLKTVIWHSRLSEGERFDAWFALANGEARIVVGARSAIWAPVKNLRLIIIDEEHEPAYKQEGTPCYHGRDVAVYRAMLCQGLCLLGSATPSLESLYNARLGKYRLNRLTQRVDDRSLPTFHIIDMRREAVQQKGGLFSQRLAEKLQDRFERREQSLLFLNRRGYARSAVCPQCGYVMKCRDCNLPLTYHRTESKLRCHLCEHQQPTADHCPQCNQSSLRYQGYGTQKIEAALQRLLPPARIARIDGDTMVKKQLFRQRLAAFRTGKIDVLVGTQMIAKGLDFPNVTLVGIVDADLSLHIPDFRASERTFQLLVQVSGRAGRGDRAGEVVVQTYTPYSPPIQFARQHDFEGFLLEELAQREAFHYPPYRHLIRHLFRGKNPYKVNFFIEQWARQLEAVIDPKQIEIRGPAPAPIEKLRGYYRFQLWYFTKSVTRLLPTLLSLRLQFACDPSVVDTLDIDPVAIS